VSVHPRRRRRVALALLALLMPGLAFAAALQVQVADAQGRPLPGAVVFLQSPEAAAAVKPLAGVEIAQQARQFAPPVSVVTVGTAVAFPNRDTVRHHVYSFSPTKRFEIKLYIGTPVAPVVFDQPGVAVLGCNIHDTMAAWVLVLDTPWFGSTDAQGRLHLDKLPAGPYRLRAWHPSLPVGDPASDQALVLPAAGARAELRLAGARP
jgi:plastocyanin